MEIHQCERGYVFIDGSRDAFQGRPLWDVLRAFSTKRELLQYLDNTLPPDAPEVNPVPMYTHVDGLGGIPRMDLPEGQMRIYDPNDATQRRR